MNTNKMENYKIKVKTIRGHILTFTVDSYELVDGFISFTDKVTSTKLRFHGSNCEMEVIDEHL